MPMARNGTLKLAVMSVSGWERPPFLLFPPLEGREGLEWEGFNLCR